MGGGGDKELQEEDNEHAPHALFKVAAEAEAGTRP